MKSENGKSYKAITIRVPRSLHKLIRNALFEREVTAQEFILNKLIDMANSTPIKTETHFLET